MAFLVPLVIALGPAIVPAIVAVGFGVAQMEQQKHDRRRLQTQQEQAALDAKERAETAAEDERSQVSRTRQSLIARRNTQGPIQLQAPTLRI